MMRRAIKLASALALVLVLGGCASGVTRMDGHASASAAAAPTKVDPVVKSVSLWLNDDAKKLVADNIKFNPENLRNMVERSLAAQNLVVPEAVQTLDIEVTSFRVRSNFSAVMFGFMAGNDNVEGIVTIKGADGVVLKRAKVTASYALGGLAGGQDDARMGWLYEAFAKHTVSELTGVPAK